MGPCNCRSLSLALWKPVANNRLLNQSIKSQVRAWPWKWQATVPEKYHICLVEGISPLAWYLVCSIMRWTADWTVQIHIHGRDAWWLEGYWSLIVMLLARSVCNIYFCHYAHHKWQIEHIEVVDDIAVSWY